MYTMYLDGVALPVTPAKLETKIKNQNKTVNLINHSEVNLLKDAGLTEIRLEAPIPHVRYPFAVYPNGFRAAAFYLAKLEQLKTSKKPFQFICVRVSPAGLPLFDTNMRVSLEGYKIDEQATEGQGLSVTIELKQYRDFGVKRITVPAAAPQPQTASAPASSPTPVTASATVEPTRPAHSAPKPKTYTVQAGDTLWAIARRTLGNGNRHPEIFSLNRSVISSPNRIRPGQILALPS